MTNTNPHSHKVTVRHDDDPNFSFYFIEYGDTEVMVSKVPVLRKWRLKRGIHRAIKRHDLASMPGTILTSAGRTANNVLSSMPAFPPDQWAKESLRKEDH